MTKKPARAVVYVRISRDREDETSTSTQERICREYAEARGWEVVAVEVDRGRSAFKADTRRAGLDRAMRLLREGAADVLVVWKLDRFVRSVAHFGKLWPQLEQAGASFASVTDLFDTTTAMGRAMLQIAVVFAELESGIKSERITVWHDERRRTGQIPNGPRPFGYQRNNRTLVIDEAEAAIIREMASRVLAGEGLLAIARDMTERRVPTLRGADHWNPISVKRYLTTPTTAGLRRDGAAVLPGTWEPILDRETWDELRAVLLDAKRRQMTTNKRQWLLSGPILTCGKCGSYFRARRSKSWAQWPRYVCHGCDQSVPVAALDELVSAAVLDLLDRQAWDRLRATGAAPIVDVEALDRELAELAAMYAAGEVTMAEWRVMRQGITDRVASAESRPASLPTLDDVRAEWPDLDVEAKLLVLNTVIDSITISPGKHTGPRFNTDRVSIAWAV